MAAASPPIEGPSRVKPKLAPDWFDRLLSGASLVLLAAIGIALFRGAQEWGEVPPIIWAHIATIVTATSLTPVMLLRRRGDRLHRQLGWVWVAAMMLTAASTFGIREINGGTLSWIHLLSAWTLIQVPLIVWAARTHRVEQHRKAVRGIVAGALIIAGAFTFPPFRLFGQWLYG
jgi:uncharacterized membrane protein